MLSWDDYKLTLPVMMGYVPVGAIFGVLVTQSGFDWYIAPLMSLIVFAGAGQFLLLSMLNAGADIITITIAVGFINMRHLVYGLPFIDCAWGNGRRYWWQKYLFAFWLTDETYSILTTHHKLKNTTKMLLIAAINYVYWFLGGTMGALLGQALPKFAGLEYAMTALFFVLCYEQARVVKKITPFFIAICAVIIAYIMIPQSLFSPAIILSMIALLCCFYYQKDRGAL